VKTELSSYFDFIAYCLMPNHFHFLMQVKAPAYSSDYFKSSDEYSRLISNKIGVLLRSYTRAINNQQERTGSLFQQKSKAKCLNSLNRSTGNYLSTCFNYIHHNPVVSGLVDRPEQWRYSSFHEYSGTRVQKFCNIDHGSDVLNLDLTEFLYQ
jgi:putative transposase